MSAFKLLALLPFCASALRELHQAQAAAEAEDALQKKSCPEGLIKLDDMCLIGGMNFTMAGSINAQAVFVEEIANAIEDPKLLGPIMAEVEGIWEEHEETAREMVKEYMHVLHEIEKALPTTVFVAEHTLEHFLIHGIAHTFHHAAHALSHGGHAGAELFGALSVGTEAIGSALGSPFIMSMQILLLYVQVTMKKLDAWEESANIANAMIQKSNCLSQRLHWRDFDVLDGQGRAQKGFFKEDIVGMCGKDTLAELAAETLKANKELQRMFAAIADVGRCLYPAKYKSEKVSCIEAIIPSLRETHGEVGLLHAALSLANAFGATTDSLIANEKFGSHIDTMFNLEFPPAPDSVAQVKKLAAASPPLKAVSCVALVASQRAFAKSFALLTEAIPVWMRTYARGMFKPGFSTEWHPCRAVFNPLEDASTCNKEHYSFPSDRLGVPSCPVAYSSKIWDSSPGH
mmetsp:Transcript_62147/g.115307  ORF Transcript_62147/g.115307 Transcript_62147/m.115307 type:complete len:459 (+) Transcript_62147:82-1458(+)